MSSACDTFAPAEARRLPVRVRPDLVIAPQFYGSVRYWLVKDPLALRYFHLGDEEHAILKMLDGQSSLGDVRRRIEAAFAPLQVTLDQLHGFVSHLHQSGLVLGDSPGQAEELLRRRSQRRHQAWMRALGSILSIRFRGLDPERLLRWLYPRCVWMFSLWFLLACLGLVASAVAMAVVEFDVLVQKLGRTTEFFSAGNFIWLAVALGLAKCLHEMGHAITCKHFGGECHEIGLMLLVGTPCLYCDVSDAWLLAGKWHRIAVSAAGIIVEIILASVCLFLWWFSQPGLLNTLLLNIVAICSLNTLLLNGNPLLRYDGYFVLADWLETPNLSQQAQTMVSRFLCRLLLGGEAPLGRYLPNRVRTFVGIYGIASPVYRWCVMLGIFWMMHKILKPHGLEILAEMLAAVVILGMIAMPIVRLGGRIFRPGFREQIRPRRVMWSSCLCALAVTAGLLVPLPFRVNAPLVLQPQDGHDVYAVIPGRLVEAVQPGTPVENGQILARLADPEIAREIARLSDQRDQQRLRLENLRLRLLADPSVAPQIPAAEEALTGLNAQLHQRQLEQEHLLPRAPTAGVVIAPPRAPDPPYQRGEVGSWRGGLLETKNIGAWLASGTLLCVIGDPTRLEAVLVIGQDDMEFIRNGQRVRLKLAMLPGRVLEGTVVEVAKTDLKVAPRELVVQSDLPNRQTRPGIRRPATTSYQARVAIDDCPPGLLVGARGQAKVLAAPQSLGERLLRWLSQVFRFAL
jgi:putative peptide zinc metalloprotease protein